MAKITIDTKPIRQLWPGVFKNLTPSRILVLGFGAVILIGGLLLTIPAVSRNGQPLRFLDALFTSTSAVCVTGLVVVDTGIHYSTLGHFIIIALIQTGGLGIMTMSTLIALLLGRRIGLKGRILIQESFNQFSLAGLVRLIINVLIVTAIFEFTGGLILSLRFLADFPPARAFAFGFFHSISAFCNAGFDLFGQVFGPYSSISHYVSDWTVILTVGGLVVCGGLGFPVIMELAKYPKTRHLSLHAKMALSISFLLILSGAILIFLFEINNPKTLGMLNPAGKFLGVLYQSITPRTAGFNSLDISQMRIATWFILIVFMFIGASPSSTGGGVKTTTIGVLLATIFATVRGKQDVELFERRFPQDLINRAFTLTFIALVWVCLVTLVMTLAEPYTFIRLLFEVTSAFGTVGLSTGITPSLSDISKILLILTMFIGRVGPLTVMIAITDVEHKPSGRFITDRVMIG
ncbi:MAG: TrkH family potassium uptake protein [Firmicutes bacterium]|nr:TrkH family potassium uptake protein [Bacillota bacterium]